MVAHADMQQPRLRPLPLPLAERDRAALPLKLPSPLRVLQAQGLHVVSTPSLMSQAFLGRGYSEGGLRGLSGASTPCADEQSFPTQRLLLSVVNSQNLGLHREHCAGALQRLDVT